MYKLLTFSIILFITFFTTSMIDSPTTNNDGDKFLTDPKIGASLKKMMESNDPFAFAIFEVPATGQFVQFAGNKEQELVFDLPSAQLSPQEFEKATEVLKPYGIEHEIIKMYGDKDAAEIVGETGVFSKEIGKDIHLGVELASRIIIDVYGEPENTTLTIITP